ncbi:Thioredoxin Trx2 [Helicobacter bizzozeronii]|uniref:thioredoxin family protein n=1 Tax=Helicobacter bizzozeronii TaxID=56877 RepID=UPI000CEF3BFE|nr:thioredoxin family protein [Helicobacter bizzozeronii]GMB92937.1 Thioredoxin Trx2 [Helicobacter bizzozeronii]
MIETINSAQYATKIQKGVVVVDVGAHWCPDCRKIEPIMELLAKNYAPHVQFFKVDFDKSRDLKEQLGIKRIPTLIFYKEGVEVGERLVEPDSKSVIEKALQGLL